MVSDGPFIFHMYISCDKSFPLVSTFFTCDNTLDILGWVKDGGWSVCKHFFEDKLQKPLVGEL